MERQMSHVPLTVVNILCDYGFLCSLLEKVPIFVYCSLFIDLMEPGEARINIFLMNGDV